jgi:glycerol-3-phosphate cytidylyltransferase-like family protein
MRQIVIMPGGFHPFHAGHAALYKSAVKAFNNADVYVAATNDTKTRPFPFAIKEKLAKLAGVADKHFVQVKSPFKAEEITQHYNPDEDVLIFVRSEKDKTEQPKPGGTKKDGSPAYFQPWTGKNLQPFNKHAYIAYLPTVEFGPGITSASEIRAAWPTLNDKRKIAMVMSLYPVTQKNPKLAANVVKMLDMGMGEQENVEEAKKKKKKKSSRGMRSYFFPGYGYYGGYSGDEGGGGDGGGGESIDHNMTEGPFVQRIMHPKKVSIYLKLGKGSKLVATDIPYEILDGYVKKVIQKYPQFKPSDFSFRSSDKVTENLGIPYPTTYEQENNKFKHRGPMRITAMTEFAPPGSNDREPDEEEILRQLAAQWWNGTEQQMRKAQQTLQAMGWEIGQDESGDDDAGVFVIGIGDVNGDSYIALPHSALGLNEDYLNEI